MWDLIAVPTECIQEEDESSNQLETVDGASLIVKIKWIWRKHHAMEVGIMGLSVEFTLIGAQCGPVWRTEG